MTLLLEPPLEAVWTDQAGPMTVLYDDDWEPPPLTEPSFEVAHWLAELDAASAPPPVGREEPGRLADWASQESRGSAMHRRHHRGCGRRRR